MDELSFRFRTKLWMYSGKAAWFFATLPKDISDKIKFFVGNTRRGWGSVRVTAQIGKSEWKTSIFPDSKAGAYLLPIKAAIRKSEKLSDGSPTTIKITIEESLP